MPSRYGAVLLAMAGLARFSAQADVASSLKGIQDAVKTGLWTISTSISTSTSTLGVATAICPASTVVFVQKTVQVPEVRIRVEFEKIDSNPWTSKMERGVTSLTDQGEATANCTATVSGEAGLCGLFAGPKALNALGALKGSFLPFDAGAALLESLEAALGSHALG